MRYQTLEVEVDHGRVRIPAAEVPPVKARALLTLLEADPMPGSQPAQSTGAGLRRLLAQRDFPLTPEQFQASMIADFWEQ